MLEENFKDIDDDFLTLIGRYFHKSSFKTKRQIIQLAENGQFNAAIFCLKEKIKFDKKNFIYNFIKTYGTNEKYILLFEAINNLTSNKAQYKIFDELLTAMHENKIYNTKVHPLIWMRNGEVACIDENVFFTDLLNNKLEILRMEKYAKLRQLRSFYLESDYFAKKCRATEVFLEAFLDNKPMFANVLNLIDKIEDIMVLEPDISENMEKLIIKKYQAHPSDPILAYSYANLYITAMQCDHANNLQKQFNKNPQITEDINKIFSDLAARPLKTIEEEKMLS